MLKTFPLQIFHASVSNIAMLSDDERFCFLLINNALLNNIIDIHMENFFCKLLVGLSQKRVKRLSGICHPISLLLLY